MTFESLLLYQIQWPEIPEANSEPSQVVVIKTHRTCKLKHPKPVRNKHSTTASTTSRKCLLF